MPETRGPFELFVTLNDTTEMIITGVTASTNLSVVLTSLGDMQTLNVTMPTNGTMSITVFGVDDFKADGVQVVTMSFAAETPLESLGQMNATALNMDDDTAGLLFLQDTFTTVVRTGLSSIY